MARCDVGSAREAGVSCATFYRLQAQVAAQVGRFRADLRSLASATRRRGGLSGRDAATAARFDKYMGRGAARGYNNIVLVNNVLLNAEVQLRSTEALTAFNRTLTSGGTTETGRMILGNELDTTTILHEAIHYGTTAWRRQGDTPIIRDGGIFDSYETYGMLEAAIERARYGWRHTSTSAASISWLVTGP